MTSQRRSDSGGESLRVALFRAVRMLDVILPPMLFEWFVDKTSRMRAARLATKHPELLKWAEIAAKKVGGIDAARALRESLMSEWRVAATYACRDRFSEPRWRRRMRTVDAGDGDGEQAAAGETFGCVVGFLHSTGHRLLPAILALQNTRVGVLRFKEMGRDERVGALPSGQVSQFGQGRYRAALRHVSTGGTLLVSVDHSKGNRVPLPTQYGLVWGALGAVRIADMARAPLRPVCIRELARLRFEVTLHPEITMTGNTEVRTTAVWHALKADVKGAPRQWSQELMRCLVGPDLQ